MALRKVTVFDHSGEAIEPTDEDGQAKPCVLGVRWVNPETLETIYVRGGQRTGPKGEVLAQIAPSIRVPGVQRRAEIQQEVRHVQELEKSRS